MKIIIVIFLILISLSCKKENSSVSNQDNKKNVDTLVYTPIIINAKYGKGITDIDKNNYKTVIINGQEWMGENLKVTKYNDGSPITGASIGFTDPYDTLHKIGKFGYYDYMNTDKTYFETYGLLYNWYAIKSDKLCPSGWHMPVKSDFEKLITNLGGKFQAGDKLKESGTKHWYTSSNEVTNSSLFTALPAGFRFDTQGWDIRVNTYFWSRTDSTYHNAYCMRLNKDISTAILSIGSKNMGVSVRCIKD